MRKRQSGEQDTAQGQEIGGRGQGAGGCFAAAATDRKTTIVVQVARARSRNGAKTIVLFCPWSLGSG